MEQIFWFCFKRQLYDLYDLLITQKLISCDIDEFSSHFTGKKWPAAKIYNHKLNWSGGERLLKILSEHLHENKFINSSLKKHFNIKPVSIPVSVQKTRVFANALKRLFPEKTGYRCKERLFYRPGNYESYIKKLNVNVS